MGSCYHWHFSYWVVRFYPCMFLEALYILQFYSSIGCVNYKQLPFPGGLFSHYLLYPLTLFILKCVVCFWKIYYPHHLLILLESNGWKWGQHFTLALKPVVETPASHTGMSGSFLSSGSGLQHLINEDFGRQRGMDQVTGFPSHTWWDLDWVSKLLALNLAQPQLLQAFAESVSLNKKLELSVFQPLFLKHDQQCQIVYIYRRTETNIYCLWKVHFTIYWAPTVYLILC